MEKIDKKVEAIKKLQKELEHRKKVEKEAEILICEGEFEKATALLATLDDSVVKELAEAGMDEEKPDNKSLVKHSDVFTNANGIKVMIEVETECSTHDKLRETLSFIAQSSHQFYLEAAEKIKSKL